MFFDFKSTFPQVTIFSLNQLPISTDKPKKKLICLVEQMLEANQKVKTAKTDKDVAFYNKKCKGLDIEIDKLVYEIYGLTDDEINVIEGNYKFR